MILLFRIALGVGIATVAGCVIWTVVHIINAIAAGLAEILAGAL